VLTYIRKDVGDGNVAYVGGGMMKCGMVFCVGHPFETGYVDFVSFVCEACLVNNKVLEFASY